MSGEDQEVRQAVAEDGLQWGQWLAQPWGHAALEPGENSAEPARWRWPRSEMGVSWTLPKEQSSALQVTLRNSARPVHQLSPVG